MRAESKFDRAIADREGEELARRSADTLLSAEIRMVNDLDRMAENCAFVYAGASSIVQFGGMLGLAKRKSITLSSAGRAFRLFPEVENRVAARILPIESAAALAKILDHPVLKEDAWKWLDRAAPGG